MANDRTPRTEETRESEKQPEAWVNPGLLPDPPPNPGWVYRWVRTSSLGLSDPTNVSARFREGWQPVPREEWQDMQLGLMQDHRTQYPENLEVGGLLLCKMPEERARQRQRHFERVAANQIAASDNNFMRDADPRMPLLKPERTSTVTFGSGRPQR